MVRGACINHIGYSKNGYGFRTTKPTGYAHRHAFRTAKGPIPKGHQVDHLCRNTKCINPDHLEAVPQKVNLQREHAALAQDKTVAANDLEAFYGRRA